MRRQIEGNDFKTKRSLKIADTVPVCRYQRIGAGSLQKEDDEMRRQNRSRMALAAQQRDRQPGSGLW